MNATVLDAVVTQPCPAAAAPRRVCLVTEAAGGGVGRHFLDLAVGLRDRGVEVVAIYSPTRCDVSFRSRLEGIDGVRFVPLAMRRAIHPLDAFDLTRLTTCIRQQGPFDLIHGHSSKGGALARLAARLLGVPCVYTPHAFVTLDPTLPGLKRSIYGGIESWLARRTDAVIAVSEDEARHANELGIEPHKVHVVHNGIEWIDFPPRRAARERLGQALDELCVGFVGRLSSQKAPDVLVSAFALLTQQHPTARLVIVGDGPLRSAVRVQVERLGLVGRVQMLGDVVATDVMPAFDVFCLSSRYEGLPYVLLEALAAGLPVVATRVGGVAACIESDRNGLIVEPGNAEALRAALSRVAAEAELRSMFAANSKERAELFTVNRMLDETLDVYGHVMAARGGRVKSR